MSNVIIVHTDEIALKGKNRAFFERLLIENIRARLIDLGNFIVARRQGLILINSTESLDQERMIKIRAALKNVFGIAQFNFATECPADLDAIKETACAATFDWFGTFRVTAKRGEKRFPFTSMEVARQVGSAILTANKQLAVDLHQPDQTLFVEINADKAFIAVKREIGAGGLPTGSTGKVMVLLSGGIDSPVAAYRIMKRGTRAVFIHFHSYPHVGRASIEKVERLVRVLNQFQLESKLYLIPFADLQREITVKTDEALRVILYRRSMLRIAQKLAETEKALGLVTGDSIGQVASQTLENLLTVSAASDLPIYRPLIGWDKVEIIQAAREIGTYNISIEPHDDCCTLFVPHHPELRSTLEQVLAEEKKMDLTELIEKAIRQTEMLEFFEK
jgi:thiamine biosynthesis protein ThiI